LLEKNHAVLDQLIHNAHTITMKGESMRKRLAKKAELDTSNHPYGRNEMN
jgi:DNA replication protein DnaC